jgi:hypothetical protein
MSDIIITAILFFLTGLFCGERLRAKHEKPAGEKIIKEHEYYRNLSLGLQQDVNDLRRKNNDLLERNWQLDKQYSKTKVSSSANN